MQIILPCADNKNLVVDSRVESRHWCVDRLHACPGRHESLELINLLSCNMRSNIVKSRENLLPVDTKFHEAEASDTSSKPPTVLHLVMLENDEVLLERVQSAVRQHNILFVEREGKFKVYLFVAECTLVICPAMVQLAHFPIDTFISILTRNVCTSTVIKTIALKHCKR